MDQQLARIGIAVVQHGGKYLVGMRSADQVLGGMAEFPGGKCEPGESPRDCAVRECQEETGLAVEADRLLEQVRFRYPHGEVELHFWLCRPSDAASIAEEHQGFRWHESKELAQLPFPPANRSVLRLLSP